MAPKITDTKDSGRKFSLAPWSRLSSDFNRWMTKTMGFFHWVKQQKNKNQQILNPSVWYHLIVVDPSQILWVEHFGHRSDHHFGFWKIRIVEMRDEKPVF